MNKLMEQLHTISQLDYFYCPPLSLRSVCLQCGSIIPRPSGGSSPQKGTTFCDVCWQPYPFRLFTISPVKSDYDKMIILGISSCYAIYEINISLISKYNYKELVTFREGLISMLDTADEYQKLTEGRIKLAREILANTPEYRDDNRIKNIILTSITLMSKYSIVSNILCKLLVSKATMVYRHMKSLDQKDKGK